MTQCRICFIHNAVPFIGFGFLDNAVMIVAGDYIDSTLGVAFHISGFKLLLKLKKIKVCSPGRCGTREHTLRCRGYILWWLCRVVGWSYGFTTGLKWSYFEALMTNVSSQSSHLLKRTQCTLEFRRMAVKDQFYEPVSIFIKIFTGRILKTKKSVWHCFWLFARNVPTTVHWHREEKVGKGRIVFIIMINKISISFYLVLLKRIRPTSNSTSTHENSCAWSRYLCMIILLNIDGK